MKSIFSPPSARGVTGTPRPANIAGRGDQLALIELNVYGKPPEHIRARFDAQGDLSFMQREVDGQKQQLSSDQVALYRYRAEQIRQTSDAPPPGAGRSAAGALERCRAYRADLRRADGYARPR